MKFYSSPMTGLDEDMNFDQFQDWNKFDQVLL